MISPRLRQFFLLKTSVTDKCTQVQSHEMSPQAIIAGSNKAIRLQCKSKSREDCNIKIDFIFKGHCKMFALHTSKHRIQKSARLRQLHIFQFTTQRDALWNIPLLRCRGKLFCCYHLYFLWTCYSIICNRGSHITSPWTKYLTTILWMFVILFSMPLPYFLAVWMVWTKVEITPGKNMQAKVS